MLSVRFFCEKCKAYQWMRIENTPPQPPYTLKCKECKTRFENVSPKKTAHNESEG